MMACVIETIFQNPGIFFPTHHFYDTQHDAIVMNFQQTVTCQRSLRHSRDIIVTQWGFC